jgi:hypothetical protein
VEYELNTLTRSVRVEYFGDYYVWDVYYFPDVDYDDIPVVEKDIFSDIDDRNRKHLTSHNPDSLAPADYVILTDRVAFLSSRCASGSCRLTSR